ncbi:MAG TPA: hypothetical protein VG267_17755 [Terracidiphilus sp.]|jgi:hypothetical protein|nr:hypothetical protein [Terracidiphilus sp.]
MDESKTGLIRIADGIWIAAALLHIEHPDRPDFTEAEIQARVVKEGLPRGKNPQSLPTNINSHCVANRPRSRKRGDPAKLQGGSYRILYETRSGFRRLYRPGDDYHPDRLQVRNESKTQPSKEKIPEQYWHLLDWYRNWSQPSQQIASAGTFEDDPLLRLRGSGRHIWADEHADEYVERLRSEGE